MSRITIMQITHLHKNTK